MTVCNLKDETWRTHGRVDFAPPEAKLREMQKTQMRMVSREGERPPEPLPVGALVLIPWSG